MDTIGVGIIGSGFVADIHAQALGASRATGAEVFAVASPTEEHAKSFAKKHDIPMWFTDYRQLLALEEVKVVSLCLPNDLHCKATVEAAKAGKHVICEKPLCLSLAEADRMIEACAKAGVKLMYGEELCFAPKYVRMKQLVDEGAVGRVYHVKQSEKHDGPHSAWFWDVARSGGGVTLDMGCHAIEFFRWMLAPYQQVGTGRGRPRAVSVYAEMGTYVHADKTRGEDNALIIVNFENGATCLAEESWAKKGGMDDRAEVYGSEGVISADLLRGNSLLTYSEKGYGYAVEKAGSTKGWSFTMFEELWNYGFPQEMEHFISCVRENKTPLVTGEDGRAVLEIILAAYESARTGAKVKLPFKTRARRPIDLWRKSAKTS